MAGSLLSRIVLVVLLVAAAPAWAAELPGRGFEVGVRTGYAFSAGNLGATENGTDNGLGDYVGGQWPLWLDVGYRVLPELYLGGYFQYGFGFVNDDRQDLCRNANVDCSASDVRLGVMGRYNFTPAWLASPWLGLGIGYEWGSFSLHQSIIGSSNTDSGWSGFEIVNLQAGADFYVSPHLVLAPFISFSLGQFRSVSTTTTTNNTSTTTDEDLAKHSIHEWILIGARFAFQL
jgi:hypothetical protein